MSLMLGVLFYPIRYVSGTVRPMKTGESVSSVPLCPTSFHGVRDHFVTFPIAGSDTTMVLDWMELQGGPGCRFIGGGYGFGNLDVLVVVLPRLGFFLQKGHLKAGPCAVASYLGRPQIFGPDEGCSRSLSISSW